MLQGGSLRPGGTLGLDQHQSAYYVPAGADYSQELTRESYSQAAYQREYSYLN